LEKVFRETLDSIEFKNVDFSYKNNPLLSCINFKINKGTFIGISGSSGRGKTTLINLLLGFLSSPSGEILFNGRSVNAVERRAAWNRIAYVKQEPFMVYDSILKNITLFENDYDFERINGIIQVTGLKTLIDQFPEGIEKIITEDGKNISGGQRQRIAIARALYKEADVIILDEPFNELDESSELAMLHYFKQLTEAGKTVILITHNTGSFTFCNDVLTLAE
jgi:ABC-type bacteriocin/lantibiotic exporter with double-glycine peptidase domain